MLSATSAHAIRALLEIAKLPHGKAILGREIASLASIPPNYLSKILLTLGNEGYIDATRGSGGGYRMKRRAEDIRIVEIVDLFEKGKERTGCFLGGHLMCSDENACSAHDSWKQVRVTYEHFLETTTIAMITGHHGCSETQPKLTRIEPK